jgi:hypothetical protein
VLVSGCHGRFVPAVRAKRELLVSACRKHVPCRARQGACACLSPLQARSPSPTNPWRPSAISLSRPRSILPPSEDATRRWKAHCGQRECCRSIASTLSRRPVMATRNSTDPRRSIGRPCANAWRRRGCYREWRIPAGAVRQLATVRRAEIDDGFVKEPTSQDAEIDKLREIQFLA